MVMVNKSIWNNKLIRKTRINEKNNHIKKDNKIWKRNVRERSKRKIKRENFNH